jgi:simple sugar transport system permease protein
MEFFTTLVQVLDSTVRLSVPLLLACLAGLYSERSGIFDIGLEGKMLAGAFAAGAAAAVMESAWAGLAMAIVISVSLALVHGFASITHRGNQIVSGVAINFIAAGSTIILGQAWFSQGGRTPSLSAEGRFGSLSLENLDSFLTNIGFDFGTVADAVATIVSLIAYPFVFILVWLGRLIGDIPIVGQIYVELILGHSLLAYFAFAMVPFTWWVLFRTRFGLRLRAVGENPAAVDTAGISVAWLRYRAVICTGILCGFAGAYLALAMNAGFVKDMTAGRGFIALAALIFAKWRPVPAMMACLLFGFLDAAAIRLGGTPLPLVGRVPVQFFQALPYVLTVVLLAGFIGKAIPPRAGGQPYVKER